MTSFRPPPRATAPSRPYPLLYALHDGLLKPMPGVGSGPSPAESWSMARDMLSADFVLRANAKVHDGGPVTAEDVKFSFERYRGGAAVYHLGFPIAVGPRVEDIMATSIPGFSMSPYEDLELRR